MELLHLVWDVFMHLDTHLKTVVENYGALTYLILFLIIFCETGLVVTPFLPGDSLLFTVGALIALGYLNAWIAFPLLIVAAVLGDAVNYSIGHWMGPRLHEKGDGRFIKKKHLEKTHRFYEKHGKKTIILARFVPIVRTFAPFLAGVGSMHYWEFALYNITGGVLWIVSLTLCGMFFGHLPFVQKHFEMIVIGIVVVSLLPVLYEFIAHRREARAAAAAPPKAAPLQGPEAR